MQTVWSYFFWRIFWGVTWRHWVHWKIFQDFQQHNSIRLSQWLKLIRWGDNNYIICLMWVQHVPCFRLIWKASLQRIEWEMVCPAPSKADNPIQDRNEEMLAIKLMRDDDIFWQLKGWTNMTIKRWWHILAIKRMEECGNKKDGDGRCGREGLVARLWVIFSRLVSTGVA